MTPGSPYLQRVQILRFFAALLVVLGHAEHEAIVRGGIDQALGWFDWGLGVDVFFIISGFIMYYLIHDRFGEPNASRDFIIRRIFRIVPLYWIMTIIIIALIIISSASVINNKIPSIYSVLASFLFIPWPQENGDIFPIFSLGWTLNYEMMFYVLIGFALYFRKTAGLIFFFLVFAMLVACRLLGPPEWWIVRFWGDPIIGEFLLGIGLAAAFIAGWRIGLLTLLAALAAGMGFAVIFFVTSSYETLTRLITGGIPAILITGSIILYRKDISDNHAVRLLVLCGNASYALYLTHPFAIKGIAIIFGRFVIDFNWRLYMILAVMISILLALIVHLFIEKPIARLLRTKTTSTGR